jgi:hypothetical protein
MEVANALSSAISGQGRLARGRALGRRCSGTAISLRYDEIAGELTVGSHRGAFRATLPASGSWAFERWVAQAWCHYFGEAASGCGQPPTNP